MVAVIVGTTSGQPLLVEGYRGLKEREAMLPGKIVPLDAVTSLVALYNAPDNACEAARWRKELEDRNQRIKKPPPPTRLDP